MSIAPELKLKELIFGGFKSIYTITHCFRNESIDHTHHPEFASLEVYVQNYGYLYMINLLKELM